MQWQGKRVLITGHTGFKGAWLSLWLHRLGAQVTGFALPAPTEPSLFALARLDTLVEHVEGDVRDLDSVLAAVKHTQPEVVLHLAAQPLVRYSYDEPVETYATNVMGTVHVLEAVRRVESVRACVCITTDKCYENREWVWPYRESDPMGGYDPYSSSKGAAELAIAAYRRSYFNDASSCAVASVRAGNVIGGGDFATDRLLPDLLRAFSRNENPPIRSPHAVRPWQHVLEALGGYLIIAERMLGGDRSVADAWNFGPADDDARTVSWIVERLSSAWGDAPAAVDWHGSVPHEAGLLKLDISKARAHLGWRPALQLSDALDWIVDWQRSFLAGNDMRETTLRQIEAYVERARARGVGVPAFD